MLRIGQGYDVHRYAQNRDLILGGVKIPFELGLDGHSDADVLTHAIMDAIVGALALGDIGKFFPDTDPKYKDADSILLLNEILNVMSEKGYKIVNVDATIVAQKPKLRPFIDEIRENLASNMNIDIDCMSVKATTEENLGFTGSMEGMKSYCVILLEKK
ncbi:MAG: 2-C-methyl-D-erythritol 2,4-cyclodiphosphate synthase [Leptotrichiaceae bacterium]|jgi:2-C-methyl-D-erythritol 2,4-cyclodiphosphate synthase|nr:2-C-methyl-D-erythritol 2,4-cyclodiphosphate synthase [Leptotrichiaceae bacterium]MBP7026722.1 2-C-methyl-D-erythritol 2,4-cyclodiphosphate synthase [Leptotrichiaceae bacterium]MBP8636433.1 2-C-methyl-D-erythritol 2,4-cyclodiphosphate synthase [Leptotrichiaceae bacterium]MBP9539224.1 2-C-methyl-D-erythritol 2,4-cyclodiphosphate synthase [Leptotrichiaceae bacterium]MBP9876595.1 2-C-methyl-D-erythritol 2,4-cyclodiphosphate synthase [Leptotrichiaceae bacterium]